MQEQGKTVLVVDDNASNRKLLSALLTERGYKVFTAMSGADCLSLLCRVRPNLIILDIMMPDMDGLETCRRIRFENGLRWIPILFVTAYPFAEHVQQGLSAGGNDFIAKPFDIDVLLSRVASLLARSERLARPLTRMN